MSAESKTARQQADELSRKSNAAWEKVQLDRKSGTAQLPTHLVIIPVIACCCWPAESPLLSRMQLLGMGSQHRSLVHGVSSDIWQARTKGACGNSQPAADDATPSLVQVESLKAQSRDPSAVSTSLISHPGRGMGRPAPSEGHSIAVPACDAC